MVVSFYSCGTSSELYEALMLLIYENNGIFEHSPTNPSFGRSIGMSSGLLALSLTIFTLSASFTSNTVGGFPSDTASGGGMMQSMPVEAMVAKVVFNRVSKCSFHLPRR